MHVPDGFLDTPTSIGTALVAAAALAFALKRARSEHPGTRLAPAAGGVATFVFAAHLVNYPIGGGTSGHLLGAALAAVLVGPGTAIVCISIVLAVQMLLFADGGATALGTNVLLMAVIGVLVSWGAFLFVRRALPRGIPSIVVAAAIAGLLSVPTVALALAGLYAFAGNTPVDGGMLFAAMLGPHVLIGVGEAVITTAAVAAVIALRPDLVYGARSIPLEPAVATRRSSAFALQAGTVGVTVLLVGGIAHIASGHPDALERVAGDLGLVDTGLAVVASPFAGYLVTQLGDSWLSSTVAGFVGCAAVLAIAALTRLTADATSSRRAAPLRL
ncbi:cobalt/nickel transport system permease protein [Glaciihabitans tibetensis]|uniref:Cobalt/nickel transport system permease protein n=1 Tax=Glaciihabitans tibetensis TaxID=1266600 RepID=A0A2T0V9U7_9MICO|nr:energy-coupling factor ABC transporter permease [Glaciihabitans tibetensis]PRY66969.1 cobalt/nickel transport system permease protein [Glaciihabitans tibetensis]